MTPKDIHHLANKLGVKWDSDPRFVARCEAWVGKGHLDDMSSAELRTVAQHLKDGVKEAARMQPGDVILISPEYKANEPRIYKAFGVGSKAVQGGLTHSAIYVGGGHVVEARAGEGVTKKKLLTAVANKSYTVMRPKVPKKFRRQAVDFAHAQVGKGYDTKTLVGTATGLIALPRASAFADKHIAAAADTFTCSNLITSAYEGTPLTKLKRLAAPVHLRYSTMLKPIKHHEEIPVTHVLPTAKVGEMPAPSVLKQLKSFGPPNEWSGAVASIAGPEGRKAMSEGWKKMDAGERSTVSKAFEASFGKEAEDTRKSTTLKGLGTNTARGALAGMAGGALIAPMMGTPGQVLLGLGQHSLSQAGQGAAAGAGLGMLFEAGKLQGVQEQIAEHQLQNPDMDIPTLGKLDTGIARGQQALLGANMGQAALRGTGAGALAGLGYGIAKGHGTPTERALLAAQTTGMGALKGSLAGVGLGAIRGMGVNSGRAGERSAFLEQQAKEGSTAQDLYEAAKSIGVRAAPGTDWRHIGRGVRKGLIGGLEDIAGPSERLRAAVAANPSIEHAEVWNGGSRHLLHGDSGSVPMGSDKVRKKAVTPAERVKLRRNTAHSHPYRDPSALSEDRSRIYGGWQDIMHNPESKARLTQAYSDVLPRFIPDMEVKLPFWERMYSRTRAIGATPSGGDLNYVADHPGWHSILDTVSGDVGHLNTHPKRPRFVLSAPPEAPKQADSPEKKKALLKVEGFHQPKAKDWDAFLEDTGRKAFVAALKNDPRSDEKLKQHAEAMNRLQTGKAVASIKGALGNYDIVKLRGGGLGCTCNDWRFKRSVAPVGQRACKHIVAYENEKGR